MDEVSEAYFRNLVDQFGEYVDLSEEFRWEWVSIPHFYHTPFYVYAYAFGQLLVLALYQRFQEEHDPGPILNILAAGGSEAPAVILEKAGCDIKSPAFWESGFSVIRKLIEELEQAE